MIYCVPVRGVFETNCYFYVDEDSHAFLIDPGAQGEELLGLIRERGWMPEAILLTHGHFDHIGGIAAIRKQLDIPVLIHENGERIDEMSKRSGMDADAIIGKVCELIEAHR